MPRNRKGVVCKPLGEVGGRQRKRMDRIIKLAETVGFDGKGAYMRFTGSGHPQLVVFDPSGNEVRIRVCNTPRDEGNELKHIRRFLRKKAEPSKPEQVPMEGI